MTASAIKQPIYPGHYQTNGAVLILIADAKTREVVASRRVEANHRFKINLPEPGTINLIQAIGETICNVKRFPDPLS